MKTQIDYIKIKVAGVDKIQKENLVSHPTVINRFKLDSAKTNFNGMMLFGNNIDIYHHNETLYLNCSLPYLVHGHNFIDFPPSEAREILSYLSDLVGVDLFKGNVVAFEIGIISKCMTSFKGICNKISGVDGMELQKKDSRCLFYGKNNIQFKIYDLEKNLKRKVDKDIRNQLGWDVVENTIKIELKFNKDNRYTIAQFLTTGFEQSVKELKAILYGRIHIPDHNYAGDKFDDILFRTLLKANKYTPKGVTEMILEEINGSDLTPAKKSMRRRSLEQKMNLLKTSSAAGLSDLLQSVAEHKTNCGSSKKK